MDMVTIVFTRRRRPGSVLIRAWMHSRFSHCGLVDPMTNTVIEAVGHGVRERDLEEMVAEASHHEFVQIPCRDSAVILAAARAQIGKPYDWRGILGFWLRRDWQSDKAFICSELIAWAFASTGQPLFRQDAHRISPDHLYLPMFDR